MEIFEVCQKINDLLAHNREAEARNELIRLLDHHKANQLQYSEVVNHLIRETGLYPYLNQETASWQDRYVAEIFKVNIGGSQATLHREQSSLLASLLNGDDIAVSAPTSFGKSFVIDAYISIARPKNVMIILPTIALTDETRRRLYKKFSIHYNIITTTDAELGEQNIFIFPQERAISYLSRLESVDLLIIDEFYKASLHYDKERAPTLLKAMLKFGKKAKQKYYLAPNITNITKSVFTDGMRFIDNLNFNTVYLEKYELYKEIKNDEQRKGTALLDILSETKGKSLIYAASYSQIEKVSNLLNENLPPQDLPLLMDFAEWLTKNYDSNWKLTNMIKRGSGIHNGRLHRSLSQIQIKLFEEDRGLKNIVSTTSIIEGVNTSAENVIIWRNRKGGRGNRKLDDFTYRNIIGRGGRMFKHFIGRIYLLEEPPQETESQLDIQFPDEILDDIDDVLYKDILSKEQIDRIVTLKNEMYELIGKSAYDQLLKENVLQLNNDGFIKALAEDMLKNPKEWNGLAFLNSDDVEDWDRLLYKIINLQPGNWDTYNSTFVAFIKILSKNWTKTIPELLEELDEYEIDINLFFTLERNVTYKFAALIGDANELQKVINKGTDISSFVSKLAHAFLPTVVYQLEEYGLPRMISRKIHNARVINFEDRELNIQSVIRMFQEMPIRELLEMASLDRFDQYIIRHFYDGILPQ